MNMDKEKWIEEKLDSLTKMERVKAPEGAFVKIKQRISEQNKGNSNTGFRWVAVAAVILIAISFNAVIISDYLSPSEVIESQSDYPYVISEFSLYENE